MNANHADVCSSPEWAAYIAGEILPNITSGIDLGRELLEIGPGYGAATDWLRGAVAHVTAVEVEPEAAARLAKHYAGSNVDVVAADARSLGFADASFDSVGTFTMLHHVPTRRGQSAILAEAFRLLRPGGVLIGSDSLANDGLRAFHEGDVYNPVPPPYLLERLQRLGFVSIVVRVGDELQFVARKPEPGEGSDCESTPDDAERR